MLIIGNHVSPYARKVFVALDHKGVEYELDPIVPFFGTDAFTEVSPLRRIPVLIDGDLVLNDSTVIAEYVDERWPEPPLMPKGAADRAKARWMEEFADSRLGDLIIWRLFYQKTIVPYVWKREIDHALIEQVTTQDLPEALDWIEARAPADGFLFDHVCTADFSYACFFRNASLAGFEIDAGRWPRTAAWIARTQAVPAFAGTMKFEAAIVGVRSVDRPDALRAAGATVAEHSYGGREPHRSIMLDDGPAG
ncbi:glutathione S-transferase family protein [Sphingomonas sp. R-74633]|uniref:glutathione S-transferase family protein n=1 Tax=Sphingomonas sp. R-74633 TaxID=2751188 RepID=UPI0015D417E1|nr:glutathione S-transferase family protein [Sphingomonas sp. R-74633]NYT40363.1 glutathione S-transferase family protein [Sphingomonas sp. R-74633]